MSLGLLIENLTNPALLFFFLGILAVQMKSDLEIPESSSKFISLYLLFSIGFKGGQELAHSDWSVEIYWSLLLGLLLSVTVPFYTYFILKRRLGAFNAGAIAAAYGSVSAVTFITAIAYLDILEVSFGGHMVAVMALMEAPAIIAALVLLSIFKNGHDEGVRLGSVIKHALTNGSVVMVVGSLVIGFMATEEQAQGIAPFTTDIFKGFLALFLLTMGIESGRRIRELADYGWFPFAFSIIVPLINGTIVAAASSIFLHSPGNRFLLAILAASASYIAVPAAMRISVPKANPGLFLPMALAITFPFNITVGMPLYWAIIKTVGG